MTKKTFSAGQLTRQNTGYEELRGDVDVVGRRDLELAFIQLSDRAQPRAEVDWDAVQEYAEDMKRGDEFPPVVVYHDGATYWLADGFHRWRAARRAKFKTIAAEVRRGTLRDAMLFSVGVNAAHGLRRTNADKRRAVMRLLEDAEWSQWSDREIARCCKVSHTFVAMMRTELSGNGCQIAVPEEPAESPEKPPAEADREPPAAPTTPGETYPAGPYGAPAPAEPETRTVQRGEQVYEQRVSRAQRREAAQRRATKPAPKPVESVEGVIFEVTINDQFDVQELANRLVHLLQQDERRTLEVMVCVVDPS